MDDGSTDSSFDILKEYKQKDNRFILLRQKQLCRGGKKLWNECSKENISHF